MKRIRFGLLLACIAVVAIAAAQAAGSAEKAKRSTEIMNKARQMDIMNQLLPLLLTKDQIGKLLPKIEKSRAELRKLEAEEYETLIGLEPKLDKALKEGYEKGMIVKQSTINETYLAFRRMEAKRISTGADYGDQIYEDVSTILTKGQKKSMAGALTPNMLNPSLDPRKMTEEDRIQFFIQTILLDPQCYDVLLKLQKNSK